MATATDNKPRFRTSHVDAIVRSLDRERSFYPTYEFSGRRFMKRDIPGPKPTGRLYQNVGDVITSLGKSVEINKTIVQSDGVEVTLKQDLIDSKGKKHQIYGDQQMY